MPDKIEIIDNEGTLEKCIEQFQQMFLLGWSRYWGENNRQDNKGFGEFMDNISLMEVMTKYAI